MGRHDFLALTGGVSIHMSQRGTAKFIYHLTMSRSRRMITAEYGRDFWKQFKEISDNRFRELIDC